MIDFRFYCGTVIVIIYLLDLGLMAYRLFPIKGTGRVFFRHIYKGDNFCDYLFAFPHTNPLWKGVYSKRKEFAPFKTKEHRNKYDTPFRSKFFPFRVDLFSQGDKINLNS